LWKRFWRFDDFESGAALVREKDYDQVEFFEGGTMNHEFQAMSTPKPAAIPYTELPQAKSEERFCQEWNTYVREIGKLLAEGHETKFVLIKDERIIGLFASEEAARKEGLRRYLLEPFLVQQIRRHESILRLRGYNLPCPVSTSPSARPA
jgi:hypothetical protein